MPTFQEKLTRICETILRNTPGLTVMQCEIETGLVLAVVNVTAYVRRPAVLPPKREERRHLHRVCFDLCITLDRMLRNTGFVCLMQQRGPNICDRKTSNVKLVFTARQKAVTNA